MGSLEGEKYCLKWNDFEKNIGAAFRDLRNENDLFDVTIAGENFQIKAHKVVLTACSNLFRDIIRSNPHQHPLLYLKGTKKEDLQSLLDFVYDGEVNVSQENLSSFLLCAEELQIKGLSENMTTQSEKSETNVKSEDSDTCVENKRHLTESNLSQINKKKRILPYPNQQIINPPTKNNSAEFNSENESNFVEVKQDPDSPEQNQQFEPSKNFDVLIDNAENEEGVDMNTVEPYPTGDDFGDYDAGENSLGEQDQYVQPYEAFDNFTKKQNKETLKSKKADAVLLKIECEMSKIEDFKREELQGVLNSEFTEKGEDLNERLRGIGMGFHPKNKSRKTSQFEHNSTLCYYAYGLKCLTLVYDPKTNVLHLVGAPEVKQELTEAAEKTKENSKTFLEAGTNLIKRVFQSCPPPPQVTPSIQKTAATVWNNAFAKK